MYLVFTVLFFYLYCATSIHTTFDWSMGNTSIVLSAKTYCDSNTYLSSNYSLNKYTDTFVPTKQIYNKKYDVNGFIGYRTEDETIYVVFRGTQSIRDWIDDFHIRQIDYFLCDECKVHKGFIEAEQAVIRDVIEEVNVLRDKFENYNIVITGHSLGAALATLSAVDLNNLNVSAQLFVFGSPRIFNEEAARYVSENIIPNFVHVSHNKDIVPHLPPLNLNYFHIAHEWYESDAINNIIDCSGYENSHCSNQWKLNEGLNTNDHMWYLGIYVGCDLEKRQ